MSDTDFPLTADEGHDDLPRTFRRAREEKERAQAEREAQQTAKADGTLPPADHVYPVSHDNGYAAHDDEGVPATVTRIKVPFLSLMVFFIKAVLAAIPALILLGAIIWLMGEILQTFLPWLIKMQILIHFLE